MRHACVVWNTVCCCICIGIFTSLSESKGRRQTGTERDPEERYWSARVPGVYRGVGLIFCALGGLWLSAAVYDEDKTTGSLFLPASAVPTAFPSPPTRDHSFACRQVIFHDRPSRDLQLSLKSTRHRCNSYVCFTSHPASTHTSCSPPPSIPPHPFVAARMSKSSAATASKTPPPLSTRSAWSKGPPNTSSAPSPRSQSPALPSASSSTPTHSRRPSTLGQGVSFKDGVAGARSPVGAPKQGTHPLHCSRRGAASSLSRPAQCGRAWTPPHAGFRPRRPCGVPYRLTCAFARHAVMETLHGGVGLAVVVLARTPLAKQSRSSGSYNRSSFCSP